MDEAYHDPEADDGLNVPADDGEVVSISPVVVTPRTHLDQ